MEKLKQIDLNNFQKQFLINSKNKVFSLTNIQEIMQFNNVEILKDVSKGNKKYLL